MKERSRRNQVEHFSIVIACHVARPPTPTSKAREGTLRAYSRPLRRVWLDGETNLPRQNGKPGTSTSWPGRSKVRRSDLSIPNRTTSFIPHAHKKGSRPYARRLPSGKNTAVRGPRSVPWLFRFTRPASATPAGGFQRCRFLKALRGGLATREEVKATAVPQPEHCYPPKNGVARDTRLCRPVPSAVRCHSE